MSTPLRTLRTRIIPKESKSKEQELLCQDYPARSSASVDISEPSSSECSESSDSESDTEKNLTVSKALALEINKLNVTEAEEDIYVLFTTKRSNI